MADPARTQRRLTGRATLAGIAVLALLGGVTAYFASGKPQSSAAFLPANFAPSNTGAARASVAAAKLALPEPETVLVKTLADLRENRPDKALTEIDKVINAYPNFRLAHLIKGDLLMSRARPLSGVGMVDDAPEEQLNDLRDEARARLRRRLVDRPKDLAPRYLLQMPPEQRHALVVDTAKSTLYVYENKGGEARYVADYYVTIGKSGMDKLREGDNKTPLGVYHITSNISRESLNNRYGKLADQYGVGALPLDYPNEWDKRSARTGSGIWVHGVPFDTYSRPPRASNGCVAMTNEDYLEILKGVQIGSTPVIIANGVEWANAEATRAQRQELAQAVETWRRDWESLNTDKYLAHYSRRFSTGKTKYNAWAEHKQNVNAGKSWLKVKLDNVSIYGYPGDGNLVVVSFDQDYNSSNLAGQSRKRQFWAKEASGWRIVYEGTASSG